MNILHINTADQGGGAEGSAANLVKCLRDLGQQAVLAVGQKFSRLDYVREIRRSSPWLTRPLLALSNRLRPKVRTTRGIYPLTRTLDRLANPSQLLQFLRGQDETPSPQGCRSLDKLFNQKPDIIHCHNLHGWYFDFSALPELAETAPVILNLRDTWLLSGHCAYALDCQRWKEGCGNCPNLHAYPRCLRDQTRQNLKRKADIIRRAHAHLTAPSKWLAEQVSQSVLADLPCTVIPNGIDTHVFSPGNRSDARKHLNLPQDCPIVMFAAAPKASVFKDYETLWKAAELLLHLRPEIHLLCVGIAQPPAQINLPQLHCVPYLSDPSQMAMHYRAANLFWHAAHSEAFGKTVTEAMASGILPIATKVGGIPEQIIHGKTGFLTRHQTPEDFLRHTLAVLDSSPETQEELAQNAALRGAQFSLKQQANNFLEWYQELLEQRNSNHRCE